MNSDVINRKDAIGAILSVGHIAELSDGDAVIRVSAVNYVLRNLPSAQPDNQTNLCDSCDYSYPDCQSKNDDVIFGNGIGNDNICACNKYKPSAQLEPQWIPCSERLPEVGTYVFISKKALSFRSNLPSVCTAHRSCDPRSGKEEWIDMLFGKLDDDDVLAWMPLPAPYEEGREE